MKDWDEKTIYWVGRFLVLHDDALRVLQRTKKPGTAFFDMVQRGNTYTVRNMIQRTQLQLRDAWQGINDACEALDIDEVLSAMYQA